MSPPPVDFSPLARIYQPLEYLFFGRDLERVRFHFLPRLFFAKNILVLGDGDGRASQHLLTLLPTGTVVSIDSSAAMLKIAAARMRPSDRLRIKFCHADVREWNAGEARFDAVVTCFFLDCFSTTEVRELIARVKPNLNPGAAWIFADFSLPPRGWRRWRAKMWLRFLYPLFGYTTGLRIRTLPPSAELLCAAGFALEERKDFQQGLTCAAVYRLGPK